jgi:hypothetical protein
VYSAAAGLFFSSLFELQIYVLPAPLRACITSTDGGATNDVSPVNTCDSALLTPAIDNLIEFANNIQASAGAFNEDKCVSQSHISHPCGTHPFHRSFVFFDQGKKVLPGIISDLADTKTTLGAGDLKTVAVNDVLRTKPKQHTYHPNTTQVFPK